MTISRLIALLVLAATLLGCNRELPKVVVHEPGKYMGRSDPLLNIAGTPAQNEQLRKRFEQVQTDR